MMFSSFTSTSWRRFVFLGIRRMKRDEMHVKKTIARKVEKEINTKDDKELLLSYSLNCFNSFLIARSKKRQQISFDWLSEKFQKKKKFTCENERRWLRRDEITSNSSSKQSWKHDDFVSFENDENKNATYAKHAKLEDYDSAEPDIENEFFSGEDFLMIVMCEVDI
jgi:hypothetical protein